MNKNYLFFANFKNIKNFNKLEINKIAIINKVIYIDMKVKLYNKYINKNFQAK